MMTLTVIAALIWGSITIGLVFLVQRNTKLFSELKSFEFKTKHEAPEEVDSPRCVTHIGRPYGNT